VHARITACIASAGAILGGSASNGLWAMYVLDGFAVQSLGGGLAAPLKR
jgi:hypothetical protein